MPIETQTAASVPETCPINVLSLMHVVNPWRMRSEGYSSQFVYVCVCLSVCLSVTTLTATYLVCKTKVRYY